MKYIMKILWYLMYIPNKRFNSFIYKYWRRWGIKKLNKKMRKIDFSIYFKDLK